MKKHIRTLSVVPLAALAVSVCALYPTKTEIFTQEPIDYKEAAVRLTARPSRTLPPRISSTRRAPFSTRS